MQRYRFSLTQVVRVLSQILLLLFLSGPDFVKSECYNLYNGRRCLRKAELPSVYQPFVRGGDPCFKAKGLPLNIGLENVCFYSFGGLAECDCNVKDCGCDSHFAATDAPPPAETTTTTAANPPPPTTTTTTQSPPPTQPPAATEPPQASTTTAQIEEEEEEEEDYSKCDYGTGTSQNDNCQGDRDEYCNMSVSPWPYSQSHTHTMCSYCGIDFRKCNKICNRRVSKKVDKDLIVRLHNDYRRRVAKGQENRGRGGGQPPAQDMNEIEWDEELARVAQRWADQCPESHDKNRVIAGYEDYPFVGQNMADSWNYKYTSDRDYDQKIKDWYDEVQYFPSRRPVTFTGGSSGGQPVGHYTQIVWAELTKVGCGFISYYDRNMSWAPYRQTLICNYAPGGNYSPGNVYDAGPTAAKCPNGDNDGLCKVKKEKLKKDQEKNEN